MSDKGRQILDIRIDMGNGKFSHIRVNEKDEPDELSLDFCLKNRLDPLKCKNLISKAIEFQIDQLISEEESGKSNKFSPRYINKITRVSNSQKPIHEFKKSFRDYFNNNLRNQGRYRANLLASEYQLSSARSLKCFENTITCLHKRRASLIDARDKNNNYVLKRPQSFIPPSSTRHINTKIISKHSEKIFERMKKDRIFKLFEILTKSNVIVNEKINFHNFDHLFVEKLKPL